MIAVLGCTHYFHCAVCLIKQIIFSIEKSYRRVVDNIIILLLLKFDSHKPDRLGVVLFTSPAPESVEFLNRFQKLQWLLKLMLKSVIGGHKKVVDNSIILLVLKFYSHTSDRLEVVIFTNSVTESAQILYRFQKLHCLPNLMLQSVGVPRPGGPRADE